MTPAMIKPMVPCMENKTSVGISINRSACIHLNWIFISKDEGEVKKFILSSWSDHMGICKYSPGKYHNYIGNLGWGVGKVQLYAYAHVSDNLYIRYCTGKPN